MSKSKSVLGRGLSALLNESKTQVIVNQADTSVMVVEVPVELIEKNPYQPRVSFEKDKLAELSASIEKLGVVQPITVRQIEESRYQLISGERRLRASKIAKLKTIPCYVRSAKDEESLEMALVENIQREDLNPIEVAISYQRLLDEFSLTQEQLSDKVGKKRSTVANFIRLLKLSPVIQAGLRDHFISVGHAKLLMPLDFQDQINIYEKIISQDLTVKKTEELLKSKEEKKQSSKRNVVVQKSPFSDLESSLSKVFKVKTKIKANEKGKGFIQIDFKNKKELDDIIRTIKA